MAFTVGFDAEARQQAETLPSRSRQELADAVGQLAVDPWTGSLYYPGLPDVFRVITFGPFGAAVYLIQERRQLVTILQITYAGE